MEDGNVDVFNQVAKGLTHSAMEGINGTIFAYGQTSSGKTHTMLGSATNPGVIPMTIAEIFEFVRNV